MIKYKHINRRGTPAWPQGLLCCLSITPSHLRDMHFCHIVCYQAALCLSQMGVKPKSWRAVIFYIRSDFWKMDWKGNWDHFAHCVKVSSQLRFFPGRRSVHGAWTSASLFRVDLAVDIDGEHELSLRQHRTCTTKYNRLMHKFRHRSTRLRFGMQVYQMFEHYLITLPYLGGLTFKTSVTRDVDTSPPLLCLVPFIYSLRWFFLFSLWCHQFMVSSVLFSFSCCRCAFQWW